MSLIFICSWCDKIPDDMSQEEVDKALKEMRVSHGMCDDCRDRVMRDIHLSKDSEEQSSPT